MDQKQKNIKSILDMAGLPYSTEDEAARKKIKEICEIINQLHRRISALEKLTAEGLPGCGNHE